MIKHFPRRRATACLALLAGLFASSALIGCDRWPGEVPKPSDPDRKLPKPKTLPEAPAPDGVPASAPTP